MSIRAKLNLDENSVGVENHPVNPLAIVTVNGFVFGGTVYKFALAMWFNTKVCAKEGVFSKKSKYVPIKGNVWRSKEGQPSLKIARQKGPRHISV